jgi:predicted amidohydrolase
MTKIAVGQIEPCVGQLDRNLNLTLDTIRRAAAAGAELVVLPELAQSGYVFQHRAEAFSLAETAGAGPATRAWIGAAAELGLYVVAGFAERDGNRLYNSAFLAAPDGQWEVFRKVHLWDHEALYFEPGNLGFPTFDTEFGRVGMMICYDGWFPEAYRSLALAGVDLVCVPTNWVPIPGQAADQPAMATLLTMAAAHSNGITVAAADRIGVERGQPFIGQSLIAAHTGWPLAGPAPVDQTALLLAEVDFAQARIDRSWGAFNNPLRDRRPEAYRS